MSFGETQYCIVKEVDENGSGACLDPTKMSLVNLYFALRSSEIQLLGEELWGRERERDHLRKKKKRDF